MEAAHLQQVRRFNRLVTQRVGALEESYLRRGRPLGEARLIFEIGLDGADIRSLRDRLGLDSGYLSRLLRSLEAQGLATVGKQDEDGRVRRVRLTAKGRAELAAYDELSDALAQSLLSPLAASRRARLVAAMAEIELLLAASAIETRIEPPTSAEARWCLEEYFKELAQRFETGFDPTKSNSAADEEMTPPAGCFVVARLDGRPVGCGALKRKSKTIGEIKRMWTAPEARGRGVARRMIERLEMEARAFGLKRLRLETNRTLTEAQALYRRQGYKEVAPFNDERYAHYWFEKRL
jgi:DNA-binding MarR family transcriptional regulator/N-acetylglutamate synthase-like GNAT family acetyltransferase